MPGYGVAAVGADRRTREKTTMTHGIPGFCYGVLFVPGLLAVAISAASPASAQIAVSANDNKVVNIEGVNKIVENPAPDNATILDLGVSPPKVLGQLDVPGSVVGPPQSVAIAPDESIALVVASTKIDPADPKKTTNDNKLSVIDLKASPPAVIATIEVGAAPAGVSFSPDGKLVLVTNRGEGTVSILTVSGKTLAPTGKIPLGDAKSGPSHVAFTPDGKKALVTRDGDHRISVLAVDGAKVEDTKAYMVAGIRPYSISISPKGDVAVLTNQGGGQGDTDIISVIDLKRNPPRIVDSISVGQIPEGATMSPDGSHVAVTIQNGSQRPKTHPAYNDHGLVMVYRIDGTGLTLAAQAKVGGWGQGVAWSRDGKTLLAQSMLDKSLDVLSFDGKQLEVTGKIKVPSGPAGIRTVEK
jgi:DNA-binding beta-propeller fold protein YncE